MIIEKQSPSELQALIKANNKPGQERFQERSFKIALDVHWQEKELPAGLSAKEHYERQLGNSVLGSFISIPGGTYKIGSPAKEKNRISNEKHHKIKLSPFSIMAAAVTQEAYTKVMGTNPSYFKEAKYCPDSHKTLEVQGQKIPVCADFPVEMVSYDDALKFAERMMELDPSHKYDLASEAQLEVAYRGGTTTAYVCGKNEKVLEQYVWHRANSGNQSHGAMSKRPNKYGVYRSGVWEWAKDWYDANYAGSSGLDPQGPLSGSRRVFRGGSWGGCASDCRSAYRTFGSPDTRDGGLGFRLVRTRNS
jgi:formylglycine-generating enzyme required for sulfatase activity